MPKPDTSVANLEAPDETVVLNDADDTSEEEVENDESVEDESEKETVTPKGKTEEPDDDEPETVDESKYWESLRKEYGLPDTVKDFGEFVASHKAMVAEMQRSKERPPDPKPKEREQSFFNETPAAATYKQFLEQGRFADENTKSWYNGVSQFIDASVGGELKKHQQLFMTIAPQIDKIVKRLQSLEWNGLDEKFRRNFKLEEIQGVMQDHNFDNFDDAIRHAIFKNRPDLLSLLYDKVKKEGAQEAERKQKLVRRTSPRGGGSEQAEQKGWWKQFLTRDGEVNRERLLKLSDKDQKRVLKTLEAQGY